MLDQRGEGENQDDPDTGSGDAPEEGEGESPDGEPQGEGEGEPEPEPEPQEDWQAKFTEANEQLESLKGKTTATERNLAATRKALTDAGYKYVTDPDGNITLMPADKPSGKKEPRFNDERRKALANYFTDGEGAEPGSASKGFLDLMQSFVEDIMDGRFTEFDQTLTKRQQFQMVQSASNDRMIELFPSLDKDQKSFNRQFYDRATEIWESSYRHLPNGELIAANEASVEMGIAPAQIQKAEQRGQKKATTQKKILGPATGSQGKSGGGFRKLSFAEYSKLSQEEKEKYDQQEVDSRKK